MRAKWAPVIWENEGDPVLWSASPCSSSLYRSLCKPPGQEGRWGREGGGGGGGGTDAYSLSSWGRPVLHPISSRAPTTPSLAHTHTHRLCTLPPPTRILPGLSLQSSALITCIACHELSVWLSACLPRWSCPNVLMPGAHCSTAEIPDLARAILWLRANWSVIIKYIRGPGWRMHALQCYFNVINKQNKKQQQHFVISVDLIISKKTVTKKKLPTSIMYGWLMLFSWGKHRLRKKLLTHQWANAHANAQAYLCCGLVGPVLIRHLLK